MKISNGIELQKRYKRKSLRFEIDRRKEENRLSDYISEGFNYHEIENKHIVFTIPAYYNRNKNKASLEHYYHKVFPTDVSGYPRLDFLTKREYKKFVKIKESKRTLDVKCDYRWIKKMA